MCDLVIWSKEFGEQQFADSNASSATDLLYIALGKAFKLSRLARENASSTELHLTSTSYRIVLSLTLICGMKINHPYTNNYLTS